MERRLTSPLTLLQSSLLTHRFSSFFLSPSLSSFFHPLLLRFLPLTPSLPLHSASISLHFPSISFLTSHPPFCPLSLSTLKMSHPPLSVLPLSLPPTFSLYFMFAADSRSGEVTEAPGKWRTSLLACDVHNLDGGVQAHPCQVLSPTGMFRSLESWG